MLGSMLLSREGLLREKGQMPPWVSRLRGWRWSYYFSTQDARRCWLTMDDIARTRWTVRMRPWLWSGRQAGRPARLKSG